MKKQLKNWLARVRQKYERRISVVTVAQVPELNAYQANPLLILSVFKCLQCLREIEVQDLKLWHEYEQSFYVCPYCNGRQLIEQTIPEREFKGTDYIL